MARPFHLPHTREHYAYPCFFQGSYSAHRIAGCLTLPASEPGGPTRTLFLVGDSHAGAIYPGVAAAIDGRMRFAFMARAGTEFYPSGKQLAGGAPSAFLQATLSALRTNMKHGDVLCVMNNRGYQDYEWLESVVLTGILQPRGATLLLLGDNPHLSHFPSLCHINHNLCSGQFQEGQASDNQLQSFAGRHTDVLVFLQTPLWTAPPGEHFWGNVPGTRTNAYYDTHHLLSVGALYLTPHLCSAFEREGFFR